ncbi:hypothetical protein [Pseudomonas sp. PLMAX]|uniref:hypothetical protein n=1 Tax=Pseudomonas sp. PLMAX TaxID=2201998 RepID=UPI0038BD6469
MLKRMMKIVPLVFGSLPVVAGAAAYATYGLDLKFPNILHPSVMLDADQSMAAFLVLGFVFWPVVGVVLTLPLMKLYTIRKLARRRKLVSARSLLGK